MRWLVTGGLGFIGSHFADLLATEGEDFLIVDALTYSSNPDLYTEDRVVGDICDERLVKDVVARYKPDVVVNFAAESHVDSSYRSVPTFTRSNVDGVVSLLEAVRDKPITFVQISTDEVYGDDPFPHRETDALHPQNPYAATKAAAEFMVQTYVRSFDVAAVITRSSNNWGPRQHEEKFIPAALKAKRTGIPMVVHGYGFERDWLYVEDNVKAIYQLSVDRPGPGVCFVRNIATGEEHTLGRVLDRIGGVPHIVSPERRGVDVGYCVDPTQTWNHLGWKPPGFMSDTRWEKYVSDSPAERAEAVR